MSEEYIVDVDNLTIRFNMASEKVDNLKEYVIKLIKHELMFQEFLALKDVNLKVKRGEAWGLIAELSKGITLEAGDIIATGTPAGVGMGFTPPRFLKKGDKVTCEIDRIGQLTNYIV